MRRSDAGGNTLMALDEQDRLRLDYERTYDNYKLLADIRFKLLGLVPVASVVSASFLQGPDVGPRLWLAVPGLLATVGVVLYELRNSQLYDATIHRLKELEALLGMVPCTESADRGGLFNERPVRQRLFGIVTFWHDRALGIVYGASISAWVGVLVKPKWISMLTFLVVFFEFMRLERRRRRT